MKRLTIARWALAICLLLAIVVICVKAPSLVTLAADNMDCTLIVPPNPLSAQGLATPYKLQATNANNGPCNEANPNQSVFVQAAILDPANGKISVYSPLVIDAGTQPLVIPTAPQLPANAVVGIWGGGNDNNTTLQGTGNSLNQGRILSIFRGKTNRPSG